MCPGKIPRSGPVVAVSNHPFRIPDGVLLTDLLTRARPDVRILTNQLLGELPELARIGLMSPATEEKFSKPALISLQA